MNQKLPKILKIYQTNNDRLSSKDIFTDLENISKIQKCSFCGCSEGTLKEFSIQAYLQRQKDLRKRQRMIKDIGNAWKD